MTVDFDKLKALFQEAVEKHPPAHWESYLDAACPDDAELRLQAAGLLAAHAQGGSLLEKGPLAVEASYDATLERPPPCEAPGAVIGPYKLLEQIGQGGMGTVFMADQIEPVKRRVALKIIKPGMDTREVIVRFEAERQALALMDHPHIAKVLDAGATDAGRPYFVMELVKGVPITRYCDGAHLSVRERLELFLPVCQAIQHAHQKGIIHRDVKPSNVLVALYDGRPVPKVIDFGVAKATGPKLTEKTMFTGYGQIVGTLEYMSPEQANLNQFDIDTRSDIYSLGVLLYELLTGGTPFNQQRLRSAAFDEMLRIIREEEPPKPSTKLSTGDGLPAVAANRNVEPARLSKLVRGELDWIAMKALEKDRARRYETANAFAADVQRYLHDERVEACPPSAMYVFRKFARRNKAALATAAVVVVAMLVALVSLGSAVNVLVTSNTQIKEEQKQTSTALAREKGANNALALARAGAVADAYLALLGETRALRLAHPLGWRATALGNLRRLASMDTPQRDLVALRSEAVACLAELDAREVLRLEGHTNLVYGLDFSPDGKTLASAGYDGRVFVWDLAEGQVIRQVSDPTVATTGQWTSRAPLPVVRYHPGGGYLAYTTWGRRVEFLSCGERPSGLPALQETAQPRDIAFDRNGKLVAVSWGDGRVGLYDAATGTARRMVAARTPEVGFYMPVALSPGGDRLATRGPGEAVQVHAVGDEGESRVLGRHAGVVRSLAFSPDGTQLASASEDRTAKVWDVKNGKELLTLQGHTSKVTSVAFSPDGELVATGSDDGTLRLWATQTGQALLVLYPEVVPEAVAFSSDGTRVAVGFKELVVYQLEGRLGRHLPGHGFITPSVAFHPQQPVLVSASRSNDITLWNLATGQELERWQGFPGLIGNLAFSPDGRLLAAAPFARVRMPLWMSGDVSLVEAATGKLRQRLTGPYTAAIAFDPSGRQLALGERGGAVSVFDAASGEVVHRRQVAKGWISEVAFLGDGAQLLVAEVGGSLRVWDPADGRTLQQATLPRGLLRFAVDRGERQVAAADLTGTVRILSLSDLRVIATLEGPQEPGWTCLAFGGDGRWLAVGDSDRRTTIYDARTFQKLLSLPAQNSRILDIAFQPSGPRLAIGGAEELLTVWDLAQVEHALAGLGLGLGDATPDAAVGAAQGQLLPPFRVARGRIKESVPLEVVIWVAEQALQTYPDQPEVCMELAWIHAMGPKKFRDVPKALPLARRAVELAPDEPLCLNTLGVAYYRLGQWKGAAETLQASARANREGPTAYDLFFLAMTYRRTSQQEKAKECYDQAMRWWRGQTKLAPHEVAELRAIRTEADAVLKGEVLD